MKPLRISFDFDCTLGETIIQRKASLLINSSEYSDIFIITARNKGESYNRDLLSVAKRLGIPDSNIHYTEGSWKWRKIKELEIDIHFDDVPEECELISLNTNCIPLLIWDEWCKDSIKNDSFGKGIY
jgi:hypothetical protein